MGEEIPGKRGEHSWSLLTTLPIQQEMDPTGKTGVRSSEPGGGPSQTVQVQPVHGPD